MAKKTISLQHSGIEYINKKGKQVTADFRETDAMRAFLRLQEDNDTSGDGKVYRVYRTSDLGESLLARFSDADDAASFADLMNRNYAVLGMYKAIVK